MANDRLKAFQKSFENATPKKGTLKGLADKLKGLITRDTPPSPKLKEVIAKGLRKVRKRRKK